MAYVKINVSLGISFSISLEMGFWRDCWIILNNKKTEHGNSIVFQTFQCIMANSTFHVVAVGLKF